MADASAARTKAVFEFKSATLPLMAVILKTTDLDVLAEALDAQLADSPDFFEQEPVVIDLSLLPEDGDGRPARLRRAAQPAGAPPDPADRRARRQRRTECRGPRRRPVDGGHAGHAPPAAPPRPPRPRPSEAPQIVREVPVPANGTLVIDKPLRSGQQVYARGGDVIVMAVVNFGAEVIADGNVHVYAPLRGKAIAGARGNTEARIFTTCMEAQLVAIAGIYRTSEVALPQPVRARRSRSILTARKFSSSHPLIAAPAATEQPESKEEWHGQNCGGDLGQGRRRQDDHERKLRVGPGLAGKKTAVIDFDVGLRNLDLIMGCERRVVYDLINVIQGEANLSQALIKDKQCDNLFVLAASQTRDKEALTQEGVEKILKDLAAMDFDYIVCDSPAGIETGAMMAMHFADEALIVTNPEVSSVRDSDRILGMLGSKTKRAKEWRRADQGTPADHPLQPEPRGGRARCCRWKTSRTSCASS
jgi:septum site-determining protein MinC